MSTLFLKRVGMSFIRAFAVFFLMGAVGLWESIAAGDWDAGKSALLALVGAAGTAGIRAVQALVTTVETDPRLNP